MKFITSVYRSVSSFIKRIGPAKSLAALGVVVAFVVGGNAILGSWSQETESKPAMRAVEVKSVAELASGNAPLSIVGTVSSKSEATVRAESSGQVIRVYRNLGDRVGAGAVVAEMDHSSQSAALLQAQGAEAAAQASLDKVKKGTRTEQIAILESAETAAKSGALNTILSAYAAVDNAIPGTTDTFFSSPTSLNPRFNPQTSNSAVESDAENRRIAIGDILKRQANRAISLSPNDNLQSEFATLELELRSIRTFLDTVIAALNAGIATTDYTQTTIETYITSATAARASINSTLAAISTAKQTLETAKKNLEQGVTGAQPEDVAAAEAALTQARGSVAAARANIEKSIIRSPISGTINSFALSIGDYVSQGSEVLTVANNGALEVIAFITENDAKEIQIGQKVAFDSGATGVITRIAPALDPVTKKIEVRIGVTDPDTTLTNGQSILAEIERVARKTPTGTRITVPIVVIKVEADRVSVFTVDADSVLRAQIVELGALLGDRVEIKSGLTPDMMIVTDARGLREGQKVEIK